MSDHEILMELLEEKRRNEKQRKIQLIFTVVGIAALIIVLAVIWAKLSASVREVQTNIDRINTATQEITGLFDGLKDAGYENADQALKDLHDTTEKINELYDAFGENGAEGQRQGIEAMNSAVEKINGFFDSLSESGITQGVNDAKDWFLGLLG